MLLGAWFYGIGTPPLGAWLLLSRPFLRRVLSSPLVSEHSPAWRRLICRKAWGISCAFSWTYAFLSTLSAAQPIGYCGSCPAVSDSRWLLGNSDDLRVWLQGFRNTARPLVEGFVGAGNGS